MEVAQALVWEDELKKEMMDKLDLNEKTLKAITQLDEGDKLLGVSKDMDFKIPIANGHGEKNFGSYSNPFPWAITAKVKASIVAPPNGSWRIRVKINDNVKFDQSGIIPNQEISTKVKVGGWAKVTVTGEAWWSEKANTTLHIKGKGSI